MRPAGPRSLLGGAILVEPLTVQGIDGAIGLHAGKRRVDRRYQIGAGLEDEAELVRADRIADGRVDAPDRRRCSR